MSSYTTQVIYGCLLLEVLRAVKISLNLSEPVKQFLHCLPGAHLHHRDHVWKRPRNCQKLEIYLISQAYLRVSFQNGVEYTGKGDPVLWIGDSHTLSDK